MGSAEATKNLLSLEDGSRHLRWYEENQTKDFLHTDQDKPDVKLDLESKIQLIVKSIKALKIVV